MPITFPCSLCGAADAVTLPGEGGAVTCAACKKTQPANAYELQRILLDFARAKARVATEITASVAPDSSAEPPACPACGDDMFTAEFGCGTCGHGRPSFVARNTGAIPAVVAIGMGAIGGLGVVTVGRVFPEGPLMNVLFIVMSMAFSGFGARALVSPTTLSMSQSLGQDAWGTNQWGPSRPATYEQGMTLGSIFVVGGIGFMLIAVFMGYAIGR
jgi:hypothetical protein